MPNNCLNTMEVSLYVYPQNAVEIGFGGALYIADVRNAGVIHQNLHALFCKSRGERFLHIRKISDVANGGRSMSTVFSDQPCGGFGIGKIQIQNADSGTCRRETQR